MKNDSFATHNSSLKTLRKVPYGITQFSQTMIMSFNIVQEKTPIIIFLYINNFAFLEDIW